MNMDDFKKISTYELAKNMMDEYGCFINSIGEQQFNIIETVIGMESFLWTPEKWERILVPKDLYVYSAILESASAPHSIKMKVMDNASLMHNANEYFFLPILFDNEKTIVEYLSDKAAKHFVDKIDIGKFIDETDKYFNRYPDKTEYPFCRTAVEDLLLEKILDNKNIPHDKINYYNTYKIIESYSNTTELMKKIGNLQDQSEAMLTALLNNPYLSDEIKDEIFMNGFNMFKLNGNQKPELLKDVYRSAVNSVEGKKFGERIYQLGIKCLNNMIEKNIMPESCQLDLLKKIKSQDLVMDTALVAKMVQQSVYETVVDKAILIFTENNDIIKAGLKNVNVDSKFVKNNIQDLIKDAKHSFGKEQQAEKDIILTALRYQNLSEIHFKESFSLFNDKKEIAKSIVLNPVAPINILNQILTDKQIDKIDKLIALCNIKSQETLKIDSQKKWYNIDLEKEETMSLKERRHFLNTINLIINIDNIDVVNGEVYNLMSVDKQMQFLPEEYSNASKRLKQLLKNIIQKDEYQSAFYATKYLELLGKRDLVYMDRWSFDVRKIPSEDKLKHMKATMLGMIFDTEPHEIDALEPIRPKNIGQSTYDVYKTYRKMINYADDYLCIISAIDDYKKQSPLNITNQLNK
jgi:hypothetical protein